MGVPLVKPQGSPPGIFERQWLDILNQVGKGYWCQVKSIEMIRLACRSMDGSSEYQFPIMEIIGLHKIV
jgi:hypothetical protein